MYCTKCGEKNSENAYKCVSCGMILQGETCPPQPNPPPYVPNYLAFAIISTLMCCWPCGVVAIVYSSQVNGKIACGDIEGAWESSRLAKKWSWWSVGIMVVGFLLYMLFEVFMVLGFFAIASSAVLCQ
jgi:hypothetical protein